LTTLDWMASWIKVFLSSWIISISSSWQSGEGGEHVLSDYPKCNLCGYMKAMRWTVAAVFLNNGYENIIHPSCSSRTLPPHPPKSGIFLSSPWSYMIYWFQLGRIVPEPMSLTTIYKPLWQSREPSYWRCRMKLVSGGFDVILLVIHLPISDFFLESLPQTHSPPASASPVLGL
jgi:hypothetical protein